jgi:hypothetical protein
MALPLAMTMRSTTAGGKPFATIKILPRAHVKPVIARRLGLNKVHDLSSFSRPPLAMPQRLH